jgi:hypothetical protein
MARTREEMRLYQRDRRARLKAAQPVIDRDWAVVDTSLPHDAITGASAAEYERVRAKATAIGRAKAVVTMTNGRLDVVSREAFDAHSTPSSSRAVTRSPAARPSPEAMRGSMVAIGGRPGRGLVPQGRGYAAPPDVAAASPYMHAKQFEADTKAMLAALAARADEHAREIAALKAAAADRRTEAVELARAFAGLFSYAIRR